MKKFNQKFVLACSSPEEAKYYLFGVPDEKGSQPLAHFHGAGKAPLAIRKASQELVAFHRREHGVAKTFIADSFAPITCKEMFFADIGTIKKKDVVKTVAHLASQGKFPLMIGGDHSLTYLAVKGFQNAYHKLAVVYLDAHPDFRCSVQKKSYATVMYDIVQLPHVQPRHCIEIGLREIEPEEFMNLKENRMPYLTASDIQRNGVEVVLKKIHSVVHGLPLYLSIDMDVVDPAFAPGVSSPSPGGLTSRELLYLVTSLVRERIVGLDLVEITPRRDDHCITSHLAAKLIIEFVSKHLGMSMSRSPLKKQKEAKGF